MSSVESSPWAVREQEAPSVVDPRGAAILEWASELIGRVIDGRYRVDALLGYGATGGVFRGTRLGLDKPVAIKILHEELRYKPEIRSRFEREALAASRLSHPNCVNTIDVGEDGELSYLVMAFVEGVELADLPSPLDIELAISLILQILAALEHAHAEGIVHRDVKPENVLVITDDRGQTQVKLLDFGLAKVTLPGDQRRLTKMGQVFGTPQYMSPEQARGSDATGQSDLYSTGLIFYELLSGLPAYESDNPLELLHLQMSAPLPELTGVVPEALVPVLSRLLAKSPEDRFASAAEARVALERASSEVLGAAPHLPSNRRPTAEQLDSLFARPRRQTAPSGLLRMPAEVRPASNPTRLALPSPTSAESWLPPHQQASAVVPDRSRRPLAGRFGTIAAVLSVLAIWIGLALATRCVLT